jgi:hypothetical protein
LVSPVAYGPTISPICLPTTSFYTSYAGKEAVVVGWGSLKEGMVEIEKKNVNIPRGSV